MTEGERFPRVPTPAAGAEVPYAPVDDASAAVYGTCPYLTAGVGGWRSSTPQRDQRCGAVRPAVVLQMAKQRQLCVTPEHLGCATYRAAVALELESDPGGMSGSLLWPVARSQPIVLEPARRLGPLAVLRGSRALGQALLVGLMVVAFVVVVIARSSPAGPGGSQGDVIATEPPTASASAAAIGSPSPSATTAPTAPPTSSPQPSPTSTTAPPTATPRPTATPAPTGTRQYKVKSGDTLSGIAVAFGTTVKVLKQLNDITDPRLIRVGQVLIVP
jgi:LysM repeat protein